MRSVDVAHSVFGAPLIRFLFARLEDDETQLERAARRESRGINPTIATGARSTDTIRANLIAKRHAIGDLQQLLVLRDLPAEAPVRRIAVSALCAMAMPHRNHRGFNPTWSAWNDTNDDSRAKDRRAQPSA